MDNKIGVFDSGIGGLTTLNEIRNILPNENYIYYGDSKNNPYGEKSDEDLDKITNKITNYMVKSGVKLIVVACNTATTRCIKKLRENFPEMIFVGTEPAIKLACDSGYKNILVMATPGTVESERTQQLVAENQNPRQKITLLPCAGLAELIEAKDAVGINAKLHELLDPYKYEKIDAVVLGCTHYLHVKDLIAGILLGAKMIDGNKNVALRVKELLKEKHLLTSKNTSGTVEYIYTK